MISNRKSWHPANRKLWHSVRLETIGSGKEQERPGPAAIVTENRDENRDGIESLREQGFSRPQERRSGAGK
jgi:hypothetical protein